MRGWNVAAIGCAALTMAVTTAGCGSSSGGSSSAKSAATTSTTASTPTTSNQFGEIRLTSTAFQNAHPIPARYTCAGTDVSPPLEWKKLPSGAAELFIVALDIPKSGRNKVLWALGGIAPSEGHISDGTIPPGAVVGKSDSGKIGWAGACGGKKGERQRIAFLMYAVRSKLHLTTGFSPLAIRPRLKAATISTGLTIASYKPS